MFAIIKGIFQVFPDSLELDGFLYTDLQQATDEQLAAIDIYKLPEPPVYDASTEKLEVNYEERTWIVVPLTPEEIQQNIDTQYSLWFKRNYPKYIQYSKLLEEKRNNYQISLQIEQYLLNVATYCADILSQSIPLADLSDYPDPILEDFSNSL